MKLKLLILSFTLIATSICSGAGLKCEDIFKNSDELPYSTEHQRPRNRVLDLLFGEILIHTYFGRIKKEIEGYRTDEQLSMVRGLFNRVLRIFFSIGCNGHCSEKTILYTEDINRILSKEALKEAIGKLLKDIDKTREFSRLKKIKEERTAVIMRELTDKHDEIIKKLFQQSAKMTWTIIQRDVKGNVHGRWEAPLPEKIVKRLTVFQLTRLSTRNEDYRWVSVNIDGWGKVDIKLDLDTTNGQENTISEPKPKFLPWFYSLFYRLNRSNPTTPPETTQIEPRMDLKESELNLSIQPSKEALDLLTRVFNAIYKKDEEIQDLNNHPEINDLNTQIRKTEPSSNAIEDAKLLEQLDNLADFFTALNAAIENGESLPQSVLDLVELVSTLSLEQTSMTAILNQVDILFSYLPKFSYRADWFLILLTEMYFHDQNRFHGLGLPELQITNLSPL